ncbi:acyltransferase family protein [Xylanibacter ruminicola]|uniref:acyltransferase family protein n=1 Tax=Xylanibacter ruminicola TaxID=839 RepID=UPI00048C0C9A|nr:acyltransferase [Xylanibacter ruminicola]
MEQTKNVNRGGQKQRMIGLDILRIALALLIFMFHSKLHFQCDYWVFNSFVSMGAIAMTGFMVLSGFVLFNSYKDKDLGKIKDIKIFYLKRLITIIPLYYAVATMHVFYQIISSAISLKDVIVLLPVEAFGLQSTLSLFSVSHNVGTWFISCILICYAIYPFLQNLVLQMTKKAMVIVLIVLCLILFYIPIVRLYFHLESTAIYANPFYRLIEFFIGMIFACGCCKNENNKMQDNYIFNIIILIVAITFLILFISFGREMGIPRDYMLFNIIVLPSLSIIIVLLSRMRFSKLKHSKLILYLSGISFTFFLCQILPLWTISCKICNIIGSENNMLKITVSFVSCLIGAIIIHEFIEKPSSAIMKKWLLNKK